MKDSKALEREELERVRQRIAAQKAAREKEKDQAYSGTVPPKLDASSERPWGAPPVTLESAQKKAEEEQQRKAQQAENEAARQRQLKEIDQIKQENEARLARLRAYKGPQYVTVTTGSSAPAEGTGQGGLQPTQQQKEAFEYLRRLEESPPHPLTHITIMGTGPARQPSEAAQLAQQQEAEYARMVLEGGAARRAEAEARQLAGRAVSPARNRYSAWSSPRAKTAAVVTGVVGANAMIASIVLTYAAPSFTLQQVLTAVGLKITLGAALATTPAFLALFVAGLALLAVTGLICMFACKCTENNKAAVAAPMPNMGL